MPCFPWGPDPRVLASFAPAVGRTCLQGAWRPGTGGPLGKIKALMVEVALLARGHGRPRAGSGRTAPWRGEGPSVAPGPGPAALGAAEGPIRPELPRLFIMS